MASIETTITWGDHSVLHFYTTNLAEMTPDSYLEGVAAYVYLAPVPGAIPVYRFYNRGRKHFWTLSSVGETGGWPEEQGIAWYVPPNGEPGSDVFYRGYLGASNDHLYTLDLAEIQVSGYHLDDARFSVFSSRVDRTVPLYRLAICRTRPEAASYTVTLLHYLNGSSPANGESSCASFEVFTTYDGAVKFVKEVQVEWNSTPISDIHPKCHNWRVLQTIRT